MVAMRTVLELLRLLFFPGLAFMLAAGGLLLFLERKAAELLLGKTADGGGEGVAGREPEEAWPPTGGFTLSASLLALAVGLVSLVGARGDLLVMGLLFVSAEALPLAAMREAGGRRENALLPLAFRTAFLRAASFLSILIAASLRYPGGPDISLRSLRGEHIFSSLALWEGPYRFAVSGGLGIAVLAAVLLTLGDPAWEAGIRLPAAGPERLAADSLRAGQRVFLAAVFIVLFLGYPGAGNGGYPVWLPASLGWLLLGVLLRVGLSRSGRVGRRKVQWWATIPAFLSLALVAVSSFLA